MATKMDSTKQLYEFILNFIVEDKLKDSNVKETRFEYYSKKWINVQVIVDINNFDLELDMEYRQGKPLRLVYNSSKVNGNVTIPIDKNNFMDEYNNVIQSHIDICKNKNNSLDEQLELLETYKNSVLEFVKNETSKLESKKKQK